MDRIAPIIDRETIMSEIISQAAIYKDDERLPGDKTINDLIKELKWGRDRVVKYFDGLAEKGKIEIIYIRIRGQITKCYRPVVGHPE